MLCLVPRFKIGRNTFVSVKATLNSFCQSASATTYQVSAHALISLKVWLWGKCFYFELFFENDVSPFEADDIV